MRHPVVLVMLAFVCGVNLSAQSAGSDFTITTLTPRPDFVSGDDAPIQVRLPSSVDVTQVLVTVNGWDVTSDLHFDPTKGTLSGVIAGLQPGRNTVTASTRDSGERVQLELVNHPIVGPVFAGPHETPFICQTEQFKLQNGEPLGKPLDEHCSITTRVDYYYKSTAGGALKPLQGQLKLALTTEVSPTTDLPPDVAQVTTITGATVPFIVRIETGTINRAIYQISMLHKPGDPEPDFVTRPTGWNGRLIYTFGGGCTGGWYRQGAGTGGVVDEVMLQRGYAVASASLNAFGNNCAETLAAETMMMVKEHFIEAYGAPKFTIGWGGSGGSYQQHQIADSYPGLLDGIMPARSFPDLNSATVPFITDARLLKNYFDKNAKVAFTEEQKRQVSGFGEWATADAVYDGAGRISPTEHCPEVLPEAMRYHGTRRPNGARCDIYDHAVNVFGRDPETGFARRPLDNTGIQYGLAALNSGAITPAQFLDLNEKVGGFDSDGNFRAARTVGDLDAIRAAYQSGRVTHGGGLSAIPIIDYRAYLDDTGKGDVHVRYHSFSTRERLRKANGHSDNFVMLTDDRRSGDSLRAPVLREALSQMDQWLTAIVEDTSSDAPIEKIRRAKPADLVDACWTRDDAPQKIVEPAQFGAGMCDELYPANSFPRHVAGSPLSADVMKCQLRPISVEDYTVTFSAADMTRLRRIFPDGVCDWSKPGVEQQKPAGPWQRFGAPTAPQTSARE
jgi:hypothetical protein